MNFDSILFISCFLPAALLLYWLTPGLKAKNILLLVLSLLFYSFSGLSSLALLLIFAAVNYLIGVWIQSGRGAKIATALGIGLDVAFLGLFKYLNFLLCGIWGLQEVSLGLTAPLGISFFTFKSISYLADLSRRPDTKTDFWSFLLYVSFFPQIATGPITRYVDFAPQLTQRTHSLERTAAGLRRFVAGLGKKIILSGILGTMVDSIFALADSDINIVLAWMGAIGYCLQLFFDFSGYIDMAIGIGNIFGFSTTENFNKPYLATSIGDFWRRWHISLSGWFKDYVYIPLGGNRKGKLRTGINKWIVFLLCGIWHGASWTFVLWGIWHGVFSMLESTGVIPVKKMEKHPWICHVYTLLVVGIGFVMFRAASVTQGFTFIAAMFAGWQFTPAGLVALHQILSVQAIAACITGTLLCLPVKVRSSKYGELPSSLLCILLLAACLIALAAGDFAPSIYASF